MFPIIIDIDIDIESFDQHKYGMKWEFVQLR